MLARLRVLPAVVAGLVAMLTLLGLASGRAPVRDAVPGTAVLDGSRLPSGVVDDPAARLEVNARAVGGEPRELTLSSPDSPGFAQRSATPACPDGRGACSRGEDRLSISATAGELEPGIRTLRATAIDGHGRATRRDFKVTVLGASSTLERLLERYAPYLRYDSQETYRALSAASVTDSGLVVAGRRDVNALVGIQRRGPLADTDPTSRTPRLRLSFLGPRYLDGRAARLDDYLREAPPVQRDAQRLAADASYRDRVYGFVRLDRTGKIWLQYYFFYYYNESQGAVGRHQGDWEEVQIGLDDRRSPDVAVYAQHSSGERCPWSRVERRASAPDSTPVVYVGLGGHASLFSADRLRSGSGVADIADGMGYAVAPLVETPDVVPGWIYWPGRWGSYTPGAASGNGPTGPGQKGKWRDPAGFARAASPCTARSGVVTPPARSTVVEAPHLATRRHGSTVSARYRFGPLSPGADRPFRILVTVHPHDPGRLPSRSLTRVSGARGAVVVALPPGGGPYRVLASAFSRSGARSRVVSVPLR